MWRRSALNIRFTRPESPFSPRKRSCITNVVAPPVCGVSTNVRTPLKSGANPPVHVMRAPGTTLEQTADGPAFSVDISRSGEASLYGDLLVYPQGSDEPAFVSRGLGVYPEIQSRHTAFGLSPEQAAAMRGPVRVELREPLQNGGALIASLDTVLG